MAIDRAAIIEDVLEQLTVLGIGESAPTAEDAALVGKWLDSVYAELRQVGLNADDAGVWTLDDVPPHYRRHLVTLTVAACADPYQAEENKVVRLNIQAENAESEIARLAMPVNTGEPAQAEYF